MDGSAHIEGRSFPLSQLTHTPLSTNTWKSNASPTTSHIGGHHGLLMHGLWEGITLNLITLTLKLTIMLWYGVWIISVYRVFRLLRYKRSTRHCSRLIECLHVMWLNLTFGFVQCRVSLVSCSLIRCFKLQERRGRCPVPWLEGCLDFQTGDLLSPTRPTSPGHPPPKSSFWK
jgi:hypothetical protein